MDPHLHMLIVTRNVWRTRASLVIKRKVHGKVEIKMGMKNRTHEHQHSILQIRRVNGRLIQYS